MTSWQDLARLGWPINDVFRVANSWRGGTMRNTSDLSLNAGVAANWQWWSFNTTIGMPYVLGSVPNQTTREETAWSYDNTQNSRPFETQWTESWTNSTSATLTVATSASITLSQQITVFNVASSGFDISVSTETSSSETRESVHQLSHTWPMDVGPHEKLTLIRIITHTSEVTNYGQDFGLTPGSLVGTNGRRWEGHYFWGMPLNGLLNSPRGRMHLMGSSRRSTYAFRIIREGPNGRTSEPVVIDLVEAARARAGMNEQQIPPAILEKWNEDAKEAAGVPEDMNMVPDTKEPTEE